MNNKHSLVLLLSASALTVVSESVLAQSIDQRVEKLEQSLKGIEETQQQILNLLKGQQPAESSENKDVAGSPAQKIQMGTLFLDLFSEPIPDENAQKGAVDPNNLPIEPSSLPVASTRVQTGSSFAWGAIASERELSTYGAAESWLRLRWSGKLQVKQEGAHQFAVEVRKAEGLYGAMACRAVLRLNEEVIADVKYSGPFVDRLKTVGEPNLRSDWPAKVETGQGQRSLSPGFYDMSLFLTCVGYRQDAFKVNAVVVRMAEPSDRAPKTIAADRFGIPD